jgi:hypothetical protein
MAPSVHQEYRAAVFPLSTGTLLDIGAQQRLPRSLSPQPASNNPICTFCDANALLVETFGHSLGEDKRLGFGVRSPHGAQFRQQRLELALAGNAVERLLVLAAVQLGVGLRRSLRLAENSAPQACDRDGLAASWAVVVR